MIIFDKVKEFCYNDEIWRTVTNTRLTMKNVTLNKVFDSTTLQSLQPHVQYLRGV